MAWNPYLRAAGDCYHSTVSPLDTQPVPIRWCGPAVVEQLVASSSRQLEGGQTTIADGLEQDIAECDQVFGSPTTVAPHRLAPFRTRSAPPQRQELVLHITAGHAAGPVLDHHPAPGPASGTIHLDADDTRTLPPVTDVAVVRVGDQLDQTPNQVTAHRLLSILEESPLRIRDRSSLFPTHQPLSLARGCMLSEPSEVPI